MIARPTDDANNARRSRILVVIRWPVGGIRAWCKYVYMDPEFARYELTALLPDESEEMALREELTASGFKVIVAKGAASTGAFSRAAILQILRGGYDLVHSHGFTSAVASAFACSLRRTPHLVTPHDMVLDYQYRDFKGRILRFLILCALRSASCVQAVSAASGANLRAAFPTAFKDDGKLVIVRNGIDTAQFLSAEAVEVRDRYSIPDNAILVGFFGRFMAPKGFRYLIDAIKQYKDRSVVDVPLVVLAVGNGGFQREDQEKIRHLGLEEAFRFTGFVTDIAGLLKAVDVVAMPSVWEACGLVAMEALTAGVPIVVSDCDACMEVAAESPAKVVPMRDSASLLNALLAINDPGVKAEAARFRQSAAARFDVARTRGGIIELYDTLSRRAATISGIVN